MRSQIAESTSWITSQHHARALDLLREHDGDRPWVLTVLDHEDGIVTVSHGNAPSLLAAAIAALEGCADMVAAQFPDHPIEPLLRLYQLCLGELHEVFE